MKKIATGFIFCVISLTMASCTKKKSFEVSELEDSPETEQVKRMDLNIEAPAYGIVLGGGPRSQIQVSVEKSDGAQLRAGQKARLLIPSTKKSIPCTVVRFVRNVSAETGQAIAWLSPAQDIQLQTGDFVQARITLSTKKSVITVPRTAVFVRDGKTWIIKKSGEIEKSIPPISKDASKDEDDDKPAKSATEPKTEKKAPFTPVEVTIGESSNDLVEVVSGASVGDVVATRSTIGYLFPDFKASQEE